MGAIEKEKLEKMKNSVDKLKSQIQEKKGKNKTISTITQEKEKKKQEKPTHNSISLNDMTPKQREIFQQLDDFITKVNNKAAKKENQTIELDVDELIKNMAESDETLKKRQEERKERSRQERDLIQQMDKLVAGLSSKTH